jgi:hypothetical protein
VGSDRRWGGNDAQHAPLPHAEFSMRICECAQSPWVLIVKSGGFPVEIREGGGLKTVVGSKEKVGSGKC